MKTDRTDTLTAAEEAYAAARHGYLAGNVSGDAMRDASEKLNAARIAAETETTA